MLPLPLPLLLIAIPTLLQGAPPPPGGDRGRRGTTVRTIAIDERLAADAGLRLGDRVTLSATSGAPGGARDSAVVGAIVRRGADPSEVARAEYRVLMHLDQLQSLIGYDNRVDRFAVATRGEPAAERTLERVNA